MAAIGFCWLAAGAWAQSPVSAMDGYTPGQVMPTSPAGSYALSGFEVVNPSNGILSINIPLLTLKGRGNLSVPISVRLNGVSWDVTEEPYVYGCTQYTCSIGWGPVVNTAGWIYEGSFGAGQMAFRSAGDYCLPVSGTTQTRWNTVLTRMTFVAPNGTETEFVDQQSGGAPEPGSAGYNRGTVFKSDDGSFATFTSSSSISDPTSCDTDVTPWIRPDRSTI